MSKFRTRNFHFGKQTCALCLGKIEGKAKRVFYIKPLIGFGDDLLIPRGTHNFHKECLEPAGVYDKLYKCG